MFFLLSIATTVAGQTTGVGFAVVELFTSEGCSSCPLADKLLSEIASQYSADTTEVFALAFHVGYWDYIGWKDPYAKPEFTQRQRAYEASFGLRSIYTPQMVVNGVTEFVGSDRSAAKKAIGSELKKTSHYLVVMKSTELREMTVNLSIEIPQVPANSVLNVALVERSLTSHVRRGENNGRTLRHDNVVRAWKALPPFHQNTISIELPHDAVRENISAIAYIQEVESLEVLAAGMSIPVLRTKGM